jgi:hypothetical protein
MTKVYYTHHMVNGKHIVKVPLVGETMFVGTSRNEAKRLAKRAVAEMLQADYERIKLVLLPPS